MWRHIPKNMSVCNFKIRIINLFYMIMFVSWVISMFAAEYIKLLIALSIDTKYLFITYYNNTRYV